MSKYNIHSTRQDWERLYSHVSKFAEFDLAKFKKSQNFDSAAYAFIAGVARIEGIPFKEVTEKYPVYIGGGAIKAVAN